MPEPDAETLTIGELARETGVNAATIRFYERRGLMPEPERSPSSGYRLYSPDAGRRLNFIRHAKGLGFTLEEIQDLLELRVDPQSTCADVRWRAEAKIADIEQRMASLQGMREALVRLAERCRGEGPVSDCPILEEFDRI